MSELATFVFDDEQSHVLRVVMKNGDPWFVAKDVCAVLDHSNYRMAVEPLDDDEKGVSSTDTLGGKQGMLIISEGGLYTLILRSRQAITPGSMAHRFRKWVTGHLLPQIRRTGSYAPDPAADFNWEEIHAKVGLVREARLTAGRKAGMAMWALLGLPQIDTGARQAPSSGSQGVDIVQQFLAECTEEDPRGHVQASALHQRYSDWARANDAPAMTQRAFAMCLEALGIQKHRGRLYTYLGIRLRTKGAEIR